MMHGTMSLKLIDAKQAKDIYHYKKPVPEAAGTVFNTPDDGCCDT